jgi:anti-anti-sigma factor
MTDVRTLASTDVLSHVAIVGRLDIDGVGRIEVPFTAAVVSRRKPTLVDMSGVEFLGSMGIGLLVRCALSLQRQGARFVVYGCRPLVARTLETAQVTGVIPVVDTEAAALSALAGG